MREYTIIKTADGFRVIPNTDRSKHWMKEIGRICGQDFLREQCENNLKMFMGQVDPMSYDILNQN